MMKAPSMKQVIAVLRSKGYPVFAAKDYDLTLFGIRTKLGSSIEQGDLFDDYLGSLYREEGVLKMVIVPGTTDPGLRYLHRPINSAGTAIVVPDHYPGLWMKGPHSRKKIDAFRQKAPIAVYRDFDKDNYLDLSGPTETGIFWINMHPPQAGPGIAPRLIGPWSAGCQVPSSWSNFIKLRNLRDLQIRHTGINSFSYSLLTEEDFRHQVEHNVERP